MTIGNASTTCFVTKEFVMDVEEVRVAAHTGNVSILLFWRMRENNRSSSRAVGEPLAY
jgi:hypothetical protein